MKKIYLEKGPFIRDDNDINKMINNFIISLIPLIIYNFYLGNYNPIIGGLFTYIFETIYIKIISKEKKCYKNYGMIPGILIGLCFNSNIKILLTGCFFSILIKMLYGGYGKYIFNPTLIGCLFIHILFGEKLFVIKDTIYIILLFISFIYLLIKKDIKYKISLSYIVTVILMIYLLCSLNGLSFDNMIEQLLSLNILFIGIYLVSDMVTSPLTGIGQVLYGIFIGVFNIILMCFISNSIIVSILILNLLSNVIDKFCLKLKKRNDFIILFLIIIGLFLLISLFLKNYFL